jgi:hypothetical protein
LVVELSIAPGIIAGSKSVKGTQVMIHAERVFFDIVKKHLALGAAQEWTRSMNAKDAALRKHVVIGWDRRDIHHNLGLFVQTTIFVVGVMFPSQAFKPENIVAICLHFGSPTDTTNKQAENLDLLVESKFFAKSDFSRNTVLLAS